MYKVSLKKRLIAGLLVLVMAFMVPSVHVQGATKQTTYVKTFKLFIKEKGTIDDAKKWASEQGDNWYVVEGDVNAGADSKLKATRGVFLCYETTTDRKEAVTDIAVMNEKGNYSEAAYKRILEQQKQTYDDMVKDMKTGVAIAVRKKAKDRPIDNLPQSMLREIAAQFTIYDDPIENEEYD